MTSLTNVIHRSSGILVLLVAWQAIVSVGIIPEKFLPAPWTAFKSLLGLLASPEAQRAEMLTMMRAVVGLGLAIVLGVGLAVLGSVVRPVQYMIEPITELLRPIPPAAIVPVAIFKLGIGFKLYLFIIAIAAIWPIYLSTVAALTGVNTTLRRTGTSFGCGRWAMLFRIMLPSALPDMFTGIRIAAAISLIATVVTEMLSGRNGIGDMIFQKAFALQVADVIALTVVCGINGIILTQAVHLARILVAGWQLRMTAGARQ